MALKDELEAIIDYVKLSKPIVKENSDLFEIWQGQLLEQLLRDLAKQLSVESFEQAEHRAAPINILRKITQKRSRVYSSPPIRSVIDGTETDMALLEFYEKSLDIDVLMGQLANQFFNMHKWTNIELFVDEEMPRMRVNPADTILPWSNSRMNPTRPTAWIKFMGTAVVSETKDGGELTTIEDVIWIISDDEFLIADTSGTIRFDLMEQVEIENSSNPAGKMPFIGINRDRFALLPKPDSDTLVMSKLIPLLITDLNVSVMFQAFSIIYGIDLNFSNARMAPNALWDLKSDPESEKTPVLNKLKPEVDIDEVISFVQTQLAFWLDSMNIRPGTIGKLSRDNFASGISKIIDESDTTEDRKQQIPFFKKAEVQLWNLVMHTYHPHWVQTGQIQEKRLFSPGAVVETIFEDPKPVVDRTTVLRDVKTEIGLGLLDQKRALQRLNPNMKEDQIDEMIKDIKANQTVDVTDPVKDKKEE